METKFGKFITTKTFAVLFIAILVAAMGYMGVRIGNAVEWLCGARLYIPIAALLALMLFMLAYTQNARAEKRYLRVNAVGPIAAGAQDNGAGSIGTLMCAAKSANDTKSMGNPSGMEDRLPA